MDSRFEKHYAEELKIRRLFEEASKHEGPKEGVWLVYRDFRGKIAAYGDCYAAVYRMYSKAKERGNQYIDLDYEVDGREAGELAEAFRMYGIEKFTYSPDWEDAAEGAWQFIRHGCVLEGMAEINSGHMQVYSNEYAKVHSFVFRV